MKLPRKEFKGRKVNWDASELRRLYWEEKLPAITIAKKFSVTDSAVRRAMNRLGIPHRSVKEACILSFETGRRQHPQKRGKDNHWWKGGRTETDGYIFRRAEGHPRAKNKGQYVRENILVWEEVHNKLLPQGWVVHHLNGITTDNRPENLVALPTMKHIHILQAKAKRIRELEANVKLLERALDVNQLIFNVGEN